MATTAAKATRRAHAQARLDHEVAAIVASLGIEPAPAPRSSRDPELDQIIGLEHQANLLTQINAALATAPLATGEDMVPGDDVPVPETDEVDGSIEADNGADVHTLDVEFDRAGYEDLKLDQLKAIAMLVGGDDETVAPLRSKAAVLEAIESLVAAEGFEPVMFSIGEEGEIVPVLPPTDEAETGQERADESGEA